MEITEFVKFLFWLTLIIVAAFDVIGVIEGVKSVVDGVQKKNGTVWMPILSFVLSFVVAFFLGSLPNANIFGSTLNAVLFGGITVFAFIELVGYNIIMKWIFAVVDAGIYWFRKKVCGDDSAPAA